MSIRFSRAARRTQAGFKPGDIVLAINGHRIDDFDEMQQIVSESAGEALEITVERDGATLSSEGDPGTGREKGQFWQCAAHRHPRNQTFAGTGGFEITSRVAPPGPLWMGVQNRGVSSIRRSVTSAASSSAANRPISLGARSASRRCPGRSPASALLRSCICGGMLSVSIGLLNLFPIPLARWRSPFVLSNRGYSRTTAVRKGPGNGFSHRYRDRPDVDDICNFQ